MESKDKLAILENKLPLRAYPKKKLDKILETKFKYWLATLLSIKADNEIKLDNALPTIKHLFWSLGIDEVKKAFEMYAHGQLSIIPRPNYFDIILVGQIFKEYNKSRPMPKKTIKEPEMTQEDKEKNIYLGCITCFDSYIQTDKIIYGYTWVYDHLDDLKLLKFTDDEKRKIMSIAKEKLIEEIKLIYSHSEYKTFIRDLENKKEEQSIINTAKRMMLIRFFSSLHVKDKHIKDLL